MLAGMALAAFVTSVPLMIWEIAVRRLHLADRGGLRDARLCGARAGLHLRRSFFMRGVELIGPGRAGVFVNLVPVFGAIMAVALLGEPFAAYHVVALSSSSAASPSRNGARENAKRPLSFWRANRPCQHPQFIYGARRRIVVILIPPHGRRAQRPKGGSL